MGVRVYNDLVVQSDCGRFTGYKPCQYPGPCDSHCADYRKINERILIVHLEALGAVLRATSILSAMKRKYPLSHITWVTQAPAEKLLENNPYVDRILTTHPNDLLELASREFDLCFVVDKSLKAIGVTKQTQCERVFGFIADSKTGAILPATPAADELWRIGLDNHLKFFKNRKPETQLLVESLELGPFIRDPYIIELSESERRLSQNRRNEWAGAGQVLIGINTGCSQAIPYKKMTIAKHRELIRDLLNLDEVCIVLLGGPEDTARNLEIGKGLPVIQSPSQEGLRQGLVNVAACDIVVTGDSLGMHMGIGLGKWVVAWFGPTCSHEIDFYDRGVAVLADVPCGPCWRRSCHNQNMCYDQVDLRQIIAGVQEGKVWHKLSIKQHLSETSYSPSL